MVVRVVLEPFRELLVLFLTLGAGAVLRVVDAPERRSTWDWPVPQQSAEVEKIDHGVEGGTTMPVAPRQISVPAARRAPAANHPTSESRTSTPWKAPRQADLSRSE